ncbi:MAG TPA: NAD(P)-dependent oxidoreductase [Gemmatimonadales bacterium]|nr:NAD(P)-dependent oxidoreductase [Gemmatimonadales bacterium]
MTVEELEDVLSRPTPADVAAAADLGGDIAVVGAGGKMGPSLARLIRRALDAAGRSHRIIAVSRFSGPGLADRLKADGIEVVRADLLDPGAVRALPEVRHVILMAGHKFGSTADPSLTWATNVLLSTDVARRYAGSRIVAFSTGNVYPLNPVGGRGPREDDAVGPIGEYAQSALARERILTHLSRRHDTPMAILRLNYAVEPRYGVLRDVADRVLARMPVPLGMGYVNVIWQRDANSIAFRSLARCASPPFILNVTGIEILSIRELALEFGRRFGIAPAFEGREEGTALLSNAARCRDLFGPPTMSVTDLVSLVADWVRAGGDSLGKPTRFEEREGRF